MLRGILFSTYMVPMIAVAIVWSKLYSPTEGPLNQVLEWVGLDPQPWLSSPDTALRSLVILNVWQQVGYFTVLMVAGLTQIPDVVYEAAAIDGATGLRLLWRITLPLLRRTMLFVVVIALINAVQVFEPVAAITQGGPAGLDEHADVPHPPRRHRAHPGRARLGDGRDAAARPRRHRRPRLRPARRDVENERHASATQPSWPRGSARATACVAGERYWRGRGRASSSPAASSPPSRSCGCC